MTSSTGIFQGDLIIKATIELALEDMRNNPWVIRDCFYSLVQNPVLAQKYGMKEVLRAEEFILNNNIPVYMKNRLDKQEFPCITVSIGESYEDESLATLGDNSPCIEDYQPCDIDKPIKYIVPPFDVLSYDRTTGIVEISPDIEEYKYISEGMLAVDPDTGNGYIINGKGGVNGFLIAQDSDLNSSKLAVVPRNAYYRARRERIISKETYNIGCHVEGDTSFCIFLHSIVKYALLRYREGLLEIQNFQLSSIRSTDIIKNQAFDIENIYSRFIILRGQAEESWVKSPKRFIEAIDIVDRTEGGLKAGIKIISKDAPDEFDTEEDLWTTIDSEY